MPLPQIDTENADRNLTSLVTVLTDTPSATENLWCVGYLKLGDGAKDLNGTGGDFKIVITVAGQTVQPSPQVVEFGTEPRSSTFTVPFPVLANEEVILRVKSPNGADTDVDVTAYLLEVPVGNTIQINGDAQSATDLKDFADTGYDPVEHEVLLVNTTTTNTDMVGTDSANTTVPPTVEEIADGVWDEAKTGHTDAGKAGEQLWTDIDAIPTTAMRGTDSAATATDLATHDGKLDTAQNDLDKLTGADGATLATLQGNYAPAKAGALMGLADGAITAAKIASDTITAAKIATDAITAAKIAANAIGSSKIATDAIGAAQIADGAIDAGAIANNAITAAKIATDAITAAKIAADAIGSSELATTAIQEIARAINPQKNAAFSNLEFEMFNKTDHNPATGKTVTGKRSIDGGSYASVSGTIAEVGNGTYRFNALTADMNGDFITFRFSNADTDDTFVHVKTAS